jgi:hypothetical protein
MLPAVHAARNRMQQPQQGSSHEQFSLESRIGLTFPLERPPDGRSDAVFDSMASGDRSKCGG